MPKSTSSLCLEAYARHSCFVNVNPRYLPYEFTNKLKVCQIKDELNNIRM